MILTEAPLGDGMAPPNAIFYITHSPVDRIEWQLDAKGWAIGYSIIRGTP